MRSSLTIALVLICGSAGAAPHEEMARYFQGELTRVQEAVDQCSPEDPTAIAESWFYRRFWLRLQARAAFKIPSIAKLEVVPETELLWERDLPEGREVYRP